MSAVTSVTAELLRGMPLPRLNEDSDKDERGRVLVIAGSREVPGGALLAGVAALRAGAGKLQIATAASIAPHVGLAVPEALVVALPENPTGGVAPEAVKLLSERGQRCDAILLGPGMIDEVAVRDLAAGLLDAIAGPAIVLDAAALMHLRELQDPLRRHGGRLVITPHAGEMAGLLGLSRRDVVNDPLAAARKAAALTQGVVVLKGGSTHIVTPQGEAWSFTQGGVGLATSGSGDTLAGIAAGLLARGATPLQAALWAVHLHGMAGNRLAETHGSIGFLARELLAEIPRLMADLVER
jgi:ADP-dependent NAD(P)H-hydrate dehydratase